MDPQDERALDLGGIVLTPGATYVVIDEFRDWADVVHPVGEEFVYRGYSYAPYDDGTLLYVILRDGRETGIGFAGTEPEQARTLGSLAQYLRRRD
ncbi:MAG: DUF3601 domain-containing protein [Planctomycetes bacterium]|nr:DUF3601 domain-containing protein [Planctomycetota bacterium]